MLSSDLCTRICGAFPNGDGKRTRSGGGQEASKNRRTHCSRLGGYRRQSAPRPLQVIYEASSRTSSMCSFRTECLDETGAPCGLYSSRLGKSAPFNVLVITIQKFRFCRHPPASPRTTSTTAGTATAAKRTVPNKTKVRLAMAIVRGS